MAFNFIPKTINELNELENKTEFISIFKQLRHLHECPIAIDKNNQNKVKIARYLQDKIKISDLQTNLKCTFGDGSRGGRGLNNKGFSFERDFHNAYNMWNIGMCTDYDRTFLTIDSKTPIKNKTSYLVGALNNKRPIEMNEFVEVKNGFSDLGKLVADVRIEDSIFFSLKYGRSVSFYNAGLKRFFSDEGIYNFSIGENGSRLLKVFGIDNNHFCAALNKKYHPFEHSGSTYDIIDKYQLKYFISSIIGYGFWKIHKIEKTVKSEYITKEYATIASHPISCDVLYGGSTGIGKKVEVKVKTPKYILGFNFRSTSGSGLLTHLIVDFKDRI